MNLIDNPIYTVSHLNSEAGNLLNTHFGAILVTGEISNLSKPSSGHLYFSLKDRDAQIRCALFRFQHQRIDFPLENGQQVVVQAQVSLYEPRGDFQLIVSSMQLAGIGKLQLAFEQLKNTLEKAGLFDEAHKKLLPAFPKQIGIISSSSGAALQDILKVLRRRSPHIPVVIYPTAVQGDKASAQIVSAIQTANARAECDVLILARGGGSIEDLWSFNEAIVAQAIFESTIPIITGIGHQTDFTIADFVADHRAPTPSAAAECASPNADEYSALLSQHLSRLQKNMQAYIQLCQTHLMHLEKRLQHPSEKIRQQAQTVDQLENQLIRVMQHYLKNQREKIIHAAHILDTISPLKILQRGFSITKNKKTDRLITSHKSVKSGDCIVTRLSDGEIESVAI